MSELINTVVTDPSLTSSEKCILVWLFVKPNPHKCLTHPEIAKATRLPLKSVNVAVKALVSMNVLKRMFTGKIAVGYEMLPINDWRLGRIRKSA